MIQAHVMSVVIGLGVAAFILFLPKGASLHRVLGRVYVGALTGTAVTSFWIYELRPGRPSIFHLVSILILGLIGGGLYMIRKNRSRWLHALLMEVSVLVTVVTGASQFFDQLPLPNDAANAIVFLQVPSIVGFTLIWRAVHAERNLESPTLEPKP